MNRQDNFLTSFLEASRNLPLEAPEDRRIALAEFFYRVHQANQTHNLTGFTEIEEYVTFHLLDSMILAQHLPLFPGCTVADVGTGAGIPGMVLKLLYLDIEIFLIESIRKKAAFLIEIKNQFFLDRCHILSERAEHVAHRQEMREQCDFVTARALASLSTALELSCPLVKIGGWVVLPRGSRDDAFEHSDAEKLLGCELQNEVFYQLPGRDKKYRILFYKKTALTDLKYPRNPGQIKKRPL